MKTLGKVDETSRGFERVQFYDHNNGMCSLQQSSGIAGWSDSKPGSSFVWLGRDGEIGSRMHLDREQVAALVAHLSAWLATGSLEVGDA